ncbi:MAG: eukaryotic-like serine/threonine-protein kinase [Streptosporangiaceae bacterium]|jgi:serine/threonine protein kinase|nr:eukaryotic-like serine/threonine-protein kinase [Streptosporangiaceae bacterium]
MTQPRLLGGRYELDGVVGRGGMAEVYRARDIRLDRIVAVKTLREDLARDATFQARFRREAQSAASLNHPSIVAVYDTGEDMSAPAHVPYIVMEYVDGRTLRELLRDDRRLLPERALEITDGVLRALDYSHRNGIIHRDIKPGNVMLTRQAEVKVMDFGIARAVSDAQATMTQTAQVIGTAQYLSPEQARGERVDARSDLYSAGCLLYELLTGRPPFTGDSPVAIAYQHVRENPIPPSQVDPEIPAWADSIVLKAMAKDPADRYQSAAEMRTDIQRALSGVPVAAPPQATEMYSPGTQRMGPNTMMAGAAPTGAISPYGPDEDGYGGGRNGRRRALWWILGAVAAILIIVIAYLLLNGGGGKTDAVPSVVGMSQQAAVNSVKKAGLTPKVVKLPSSSYKAGQVFKTTPQFGTKVAPHSTVTLDVSTGPSKIKMPPVTGESESTAQSQLQQFRVTTKTDPNSAKPAGTVVRQSPKAGTLLLPNSPVTIYVSGGGTQVQNTVGDPRATAVSILQNAGFKVQIITTPGPASATPGNVFQQTPSSGILPQGSTVTIYVASTPTPTQTATTPPPSPTPTATTPSPTPTGTATLGATSSSRTPRP